MREEKVPFHRACALEHPGQLTVSNAKPSDKEAT